MLNAIGHALAMAFFMFWEIFWALILGFTLSAIVQAIVPKPVIFSQCWKKSKRELEADLTNFIVCLSSYIKNISPDPKPSLVKS